MCDIGQQDKESQFYRVMNKNAEIPLDKFKKIIDVRLFKPTIAITSTEPLLYEDIVEAIGYVKNSGLRCELTTNGLLLERYAEDLAYIGLDTLNVSIDGPPETHDMIRGVEGLYKKISGGIMNIQGYEKRPRIDINTTISNFNYHKLVDTSVEVENLGVDYHYFSHLNFITRKMMEKHNRFCRDYPVTESCVSAIDLESIDIRILHDQIKELRGRKDIRFIPKLSTVKELDTYYNKPEKFLKGHDRCTVPWRIGQIAANGDLIIMTRCFDISLGNLYQDSFIDLWDGPKMVEFRKKLRKSKAYPSCTRCCGVL